MTEQLGKPALNAGDSGALGGKRVPEPVLCERCCGNGELVTDWKRYLHPLPDDVGDEANNFAL